MTASDGTPTAIDPPQPAAANLGYALRAPDLDLDGMRFITFGSMRPLVIATAGYFSGRFKIDADWVTDFLSFLRWDVIFDGSLAFQAASSNEDNDDTTRTYRGAMIVIDSANKGGSFG